MEMRNQKMKKETCWMDCWCFKRDFDKKVRELETDVGSLFLFNFIIWVLNKAEKKDEEDEDFLKNNLKRERIVKKT